MAENEIQKEARENVVERILQNRIIAMVGFASVLIAIIFWVRTPQDELKERLLILEQKQESNQELVTKIQNIKDNDLHEIQRQNNELSQDIVNLRVDFNKLIGQLEIITGKKLQ